MAEQEGPPPLRQDGYLKVNIEENGSNSSDVVDRGAATAAEVRSIVYHPNLNIILAFDTKNYAHVVDVNSGSSLQTFQLNSQENECVYGRYLPLHDKLLMWNAHNVGLRRDYNGVLLLDTMLQAPIASDMENVRLELLLSEAIPFQNCITELAADGLVCPCDVSNELLEKINNAKAHSKKGIKAQRWNTICLDLKYSSLKTLITNIIEILCRHKRRVPVLAVASAINERLVDLHEGASKYDDDNGKTGSTWLTYSEDVRRQSLEKWPHMDYQWALPDQMAQAGFYHKPNMTGEDRAMCFACNVCLVCWERSDEPWSEHERHSPDCAFIKGDYTQNVPLAVTYATSPAQRTNESGFDVISNSDYADLLCTVSNETDQFVIWNIERQLKKVLELKLSELFQGTDQTGSIRLARVTSVCVQPNNAAKPPVQPHNVKTEDSGQVADKSQQHPNAFKARSVDCEVVVGLTTYNDEGKTVPRLAILSVFDELINSIANESYIMPSNAINLEDSIGDLKYGNALSVPLVDINDKNMDNFLDNFDNMDASFWSCDQDGGYSYPLPLSTIESQIVGMDVTEPMLEASDVDTIDNTTAQACEKISEMRCRLDFCSQSFFNGENELLEITEILPISSSRDVVLIKLEKKDTPPAASTNWFTKLMTVDCNQLTSGKFEVYAAFDYNERPIQLCMLPNYKRSSCASSDPCSFGAVSVVCANGQIQIYSLADFKLCASIASTDDQYVSVAYCASLNRLCGCTRKGNLVFYALDTYPNDVNDEILDTEEDIDMEVALMDSLADASDAASNVHKVCASSAGFTSEERIPTLFELKTDSQPNDTCDSGPASSSTSSISNPSSNTIAPNPLAFKSGALTLEDLQRLYEYTQFDEKLTPYKATAPTCWNDASQNKNQRKQPTEQTGFEPTSFSNTWRLQNDVTTWDEHIIELTLPHPVSLGHIDMKFSVHQQYSNPTAIQVTLLKQNSNGFGFHMKGQRATATATAPAVIAEATNEEAMETACAAAENPVITEEYLQTHNAEILAGPVDLSSCIDLSEQGGTAILTSPKLLKTRARHFLLHIKSLTDPTKDSQNKTRGCDWLHEITISVRGVKAEGGVDRGRVQRIAMLESNTLLEKLLGVACDSSVAAQHVMERNLALDVLIWIYFIRLNRYRSPKSESVKCEINKQTVGDMQDMLTQQLACINTVESYIESLLRHCVLHSDRTIAHKAVKLLLIITEGQWNLPNEVQTTLSSSVQQAIDNTFHELVVARNSSAVRWYTLLLTAISTAEMQLALTERCVKMLTDITSEIDARWEPLSALLNTRFGLHGYPFEIDMFEYDQRILNKTIGVSSVNNVASMRCSGGRVVGAADAPSGRDGKRQSGIDGVDFRGFPHLIRGRSIGNQLRGLLEVEQLHFTCVQSSEATRIDNIDTNTSGLLTMAMDDLGAPTPASIADIINKDNSYFDAFTTLTNSHQLVWNGQGFDGTKKLLFSQVKSHKTAPKKVPETVAMASKFADLQSIFNNAKWSKVEMLGEAADIIAVSDMMQQFPDKTVVTGKQMHTENYAIGLLHNMQKELKMQIGGYKKPITSNAKMLTDSVASCSSANSNGSSGGSSTISWPKVVSLPQKQMIVVDRMHSGARRFVVLDFGSHVLLTDVLMPSCDDLTNLQIDTWCLDETKDCTRLVIAYDIATKTLVLSDLNPPPICRFLKITFVGRLGMASTKCRIPLGTFYGHVVPMSHDCYSNAFINAIKPSPFVQELNSVAHIASLKALYEDAQCRYSLASSKLVEHLTPILNSESTNFSHMQSYFNKQRDDIEFGSNAADANKVVSFYEECLVLLYQINVIRNILERFKLTTNSASGSLPPVHQPAATFQDASSDKLRTLSLSMLEMLLHFSMEHGIKNTGGQLNQHFTIDVARKLFNSLVLYGDAHIQIATCSLLVRMCCFQSWWGDLVMELFCNLFSSQNCKVFPQDRVFFLMTYICRRSIAIGACRSIMINAILKTVAKLLAPISPHSNAEASHADIWTKSDLQLISWALMLFSICLDENNDRNNKSTRWDFMNCENDFSKARAGSQTSSKSMRGLRKRNPCPQLKHSCLTPGGILSDWGGGKVALTSEPFSYLEHHPSVLADATEQARPTTSKSATAAKQIDSSTQQGYMSGDSNFDKGLKCIPLKNVVVVIRALASYLLEMDFICNMDQFLLTCKIIARLVTACRTALQLSSIISLSQLEQLARLAVWNDNQQPWAVHAVTCLLQDLLEADKQAVSDSNPSLARSKSISNAAGDSYADVVKRSYLPSLIECEDTELDEVLADIDVIERATKTSGSTKKESTTANKSSSNYFCKSISAALDARLEKRVDFNVEVQLRRLTNIAAVDLYSSLPHIVVKEHALASPELVEWPECLYEIWNGQQYAGTMSTRAMFKDVFETIFAEMHCEDAWVHLDQVLYMWLTLNGVLADDSPTSSQQRSLSFDTPYIPFGAHAVQGLLLALAQHAEIRMRTWCLSFQCLALASDDEADCVRINEVLVNDENFERMLIRFYSGYGQSSSIITKRSAGPTLCANLYQLLSNAKTGAAGSRKLRDTLLRVVLHLVQPDGAISNYLGPIDAQCQLIIDLLTPINIKDDIGVSLKLIESVSFLVYNSLTNSEKQYHYQVSTDTNAPPYSMYYKNLLSPDGAKHLPISDATLLISLLSLMSVLVTLEVPKQPTEAPIPEDEELTMQTSQTEHSKTAAAQQAGEAAQRQKTPRVADAVLRHQPTMKRLLGALSQCSSSSFTSVETISQMSVKPNELVMGTNVVSVEDSLYQLLLKMSNVASHPRLVVAPICQYLQTSTIQSYALPRLRLSEPLLWYISKVLEPVPAVQVFTQLGGIQIICKNLVKLNRLFVNTQPGMISLIMQHLTKNSMSKYNVSSSVNPAIKKSYSAMPNSWSSSTNRIQSADLLNFAPFSTIAVDNENAPTADVLILNNNSTHRRARSPPWTHTFYVCDKHVDLTITLPTAILLHEVQLHPHAATLQSCPSAVGLEIARNFGSRPVPVGSAINTSGSTFIRLKVNPPEITTSLVLRLYRPKDSSSIGLNQISVLGQPIFAGTGSSTSLSRNSDKFDDEDNMAKTSFGWVRILWRCYYAAATLPESKLAADVIGGSATYPGFLEACCALMNITPMIPSSAHQFLEPLLLNLSDYNRNHCLSLMRLLLWNSVPQMLNLTNEAVCDLLYELFTRSDSYLQDKLQLFIDWVVKLRHNYSNLPLRCNNPQSGFVKVFASILWSIQAESRVQNVQEFVTDELYETCLYWIDHLANEDPLKVAFDSLLCALCYIKPEMYYQLLVHFSFVASIDAKPMAMDIDSEGECVGMGVNETEKLIGSKLKAILRQPKLLSTVALVSQSSVAICQLIESNFPQMLVNALKDYCHAFPQPQHTKLSGSGEEILEMVASTSAEGQKLFGRQDDRTLEDVNVAIILDFFSECCLEGPMRDWLGSTAGRVFWRPLLELLCHTCAAEYSTITQQLLVRIERATLNFFARVIICHPANQDALTAMLIEVIRELGTRTGKISISGFTRQIVLQLLLENERIYVSIRSKETLQKFRSAKASNANGGGMLLESPNCGLYMHATNTHPSRRISSHHMLFTVSTNAACRDIIRRCISDDKIEARPPTPEFNPIDTFSDDLISTEEMIAETSKSKSISMAAGVTAKNKRLKDVNNQAAAMKMLFSTQPWMHIAMPDSATPSNVPAADVGSFMQLQHADLPNVVIPEHIKISEILSSLHAFGSSLSSPYLTLNLVTAPPSTTDVNISSMCSLKPSDTLPTPLQRFSTQGGLSLLACYLPTLHPESITARKQSCSSSNGSSSSNLPEKEKSPLSSSWVKIDQHSDEVYDDFDDWALAASPKVPVPINSVPQHSLAAFGLFLRLTGYSDVLLLDKTRAQCLLRLVLGVTSDGEGNDIYSFYWANTLPTLPFEVFCTLLESNPLATEQGITLRQEVIDFGVMHLILNCLAIFTHQSQRYQLTNPPSNAPTSSSGTRTASETPAAAAGPTSTATSDDKSHVYWAKGTGYGTGSTAQSWNVEQAIMRQKSEEEHVTIFLKALSRYINPTDKSDVFSNDGGTTAAAFDAAEGVDNGSLPDSLYDLLQQSCLVPALSSYLRNDSVLDITRHIPLYRAILLLLRALVLSDQLRPLLQPQGHEHDRISIAELLSNMQTCVDTYAKRLKINKKSNLKGQNQPVTVNIDDGDDEGLASLIPDIRDTSSLVERSFKADDMRNLLANGAESCLLPIERITPPKSLDQRYIDIMKKLQFQTYDMIIESDNNSYRFTVSHHFEKNVRATGDRCHPARIKRLAQETVTLSTSLPLSYSSTVFVRCDTDRLDVMKVLITGPSDTPYADGCFEFDVYFPPEYPSTPMLINLETTGRSSVRFNPNLYNDGKVCLSVLNTWHGRPEERWNAQTSSFLQVLVSIQSLILVPEPYFNEPGFERSRGTQNGTYSSREYNNTTYHACIRWAMLEQIRNPNPCFKDVILTHFWIKRHEICAQIEKWMKELEDILIPERSSRSAPLNMIALRRQYRSLREEFFKMKMPEGLEDLDTPPFSSHSPLFDELEMPVKMISIEKITKGGKPSSSSGAGVVLKPSKKDELSLLSAELNSAISSAHDKIMDKNMLSMLIKDFTAPPIAGSGGGGGVGGGDGGILKPDENAAEVDENGNDNDNFFDDIDEAMDVDQDCADIGIDIDEDPGEWA